MNTQFVTATALDSEASPFEQLPPELLYWKIDYILPHGLTFSFERSRRTDDDGIWILFAARGKHAPRAIANRPSTKVLASHRSRVAGYGINQDSHPCGVCENAYDCEYNICLEYVCSTELLYVNKAIAREARGESQNISS